MPDMSDTTANDTQPNAGENNANSTGDTNMGSQGAGNEDAGTDETKTGDGGQQTSPTENETAKAPKDPQNVTDDEEPQTRQRMSPKDFIIKRKEAKIAKLQQQKEQKQSEHQPDADSDNDEIAPEDEELINKVVTKTFAPLLEKTMQAEDEKEITDFIKENPDFSQFEGKARKYIAHPSRRHLPIKSVFYEVAGDDLIRIGAERQKKADEEARQTQTGGGSNRVAEGQKSVWDLTPEEFAEEQEKVRRGQ